MTASTQGIHHVGLSVPDVAAAARFFCEALQFSPVGERPDYPAIFVSDGRVMLTLWQVEDPATAVAFDRRRVVGLHHLALKVESATALRRLHERLSSRADVTVEFSPAPLGAALEHMMLRIPGNLRLELVAPSA